MKLKNRILIIIVFTAVSLLFTAGCQEQAKTPPQTKPALSSQNKHPNEKIADMVSVADFGQIRLKGYGLVVGLTGTGSSECPPDIRAYLVKYINSKLPSKSKLSPNKLIDSKDTAVVTILGLLPAGATAGQRFDLAVSPIARSQTTSLVGGRLFEADLKSSTAFASTFALATAEGAVYVPQDKNTQIGYILNGGRTTKARTVLLAMKQPDFVEVSIIRDRINEKFGQGVAVAKNEAVIELEIPKKYSTQKIKFLQLVNSLYVDELPGNTSALIDKLISDLSNLGKPQEAEIALEVIGKPVMGKLALLLNSSNEEVRLRAARCLLNIGDFRGYEPLTEIALNPASERRLQAIDAVALALDRKDAAGFLQQFLDNDNFNIRFAAYNHLHRLDDISISQKTASTKSGDFYIERIVRGGRPVIWAARSGQPRIVLFGSPIYAEDDIFVESSDGSIIANRRSEDNFITIIAKNLQTGSANNLKTSPEVGLIVKTLAQEPASKKGAIVKTGLGLSYSQTVELLELMCEKGAINAKFRLGDKPAILQIIEQSGANR